MYLTTSYASSPLAQYAIVQLNWIRRECMMSEYVNREGTFSPLVFSCSDGGIGTAATAVYKRLTTLISEKRDHPYSFGSDVNFLIHYFVLQ